MISTSAEMMSGDHPLTGRRFSVTVYPSFDAFFVAHEKAQRQWHFLRVRSGPSDDSLELVGVVLNRTDLGQFRFDDS
jgi:hypothetical protein